MTRSAKINQDHHSYIPAFVLGFTSVIGQVILLRELITVFYGNEMAYAVILASWLFWVSVGSYIISRCVHRIKDPVPEISIVQGIIFFLLPATIVATRYIKVFMHVQTGEIIGIAPMCLASFLLLAPLALLLGGLFTMICLLGDQREEVSGGSSAISNTYLWEAFGAAAGGLAFSFLMVRFLPAMHMVFLTGSVNLIFWIMFYKRHNRLFIRTTTLISLTIVALLYSQVIGRLDQWTRQKQWKGLEVIATTDSIYGNITMTRIGQEYNLYENGLFSYATRDDLSSEEGVHFPLLEHSSPREVLLIGNGMGGALGEILKHPVTDVDYVELDPKTIEISRKYLPRKYSVPVKSDRVHITHADARWFVKQTKNKYDVIIVNLPDPYTALINRYYSFEFFQEAKAVLRPGGILAFSVSSSENYLNKEARVLLRALYTTLREVFPDVRAIPGNTVIFLACTEKNILTYDHQTLVDRLKKRQISTRFMREYYLPFKLSADRIFYIEDILKERGAVNTDAHPIAYLYDNVRWATHFNTSFKNVIEKIQGIQFHHFFLLLLLFYLGGWCWKRVSPTAPVTLSIMTTGFSEIVFQLIVILSFQTLYGYAYYKIGWIMASFMGGICLGTIVAKRVIGNKPRAIPRIYKMAQFGIVLYPLVLPFVFRFFQNAQTTQHFSVGTFATVFATLPVIAGLIGGLQYPLAVHLRHCSNPARGKEMARPAGLLYAADGFGAALGAFVTGTLLIPLFGITAVAFLCATINAMVFLLLYPAKLSSDL